MEFAKINTFDFAMLEDNLVIVSCLVSEVGK